METFEKTIVAINYIFRCCRRCPLHSAVGGRVSQLCDRTSFFKKVTFCCDRQSIVSLLFNCSLTLSFVPLIPLCHTIALFEA